MEPKKILDTTRRLILEHAGDDPDKWWYANRFVFARLQLDERRTKSAIKQNLLNSGGVCHGCGQPFETKRDVHLHRLDGTKGYSEGNCTLMHADCHRKEHVDGEQSAIIEMRGRKLESEKFSKRYDDKPFLYWWDISPALAESLEQFEALEFVKKDTKERCVVPTEILRRFLSPERQTSRSVGNWGIKVLKERPDELAFEPGTGGGKWRFLPVVWLEEAED